MIGPQSLRSVAEGVIQFSTIITAFIATAAHPVHDGQLGQRPSADRMASAIATKIAMDAAATKRPDRGKGPSTCPPCVILPHGAPRISAQ